MRKFHTARRAARWLQGALAFTQQKEILCWTANSSSSLLAATAASALRYVDTLPSYAPGRSLRECHVHNCPPLPADDALARRKKCPRLRGHMQPMGMQAEMADVPRVPESELTAASFYERYMASSTPVIIGGAASAALNQRSEAGAFMLNNCMDEQGAPWQAVIEEKKVVVSNTRWPLKHDWNFCDFIRNYTKSEYKDGLYCISALTDPGVKLGRHMAMPRILRCGEVHEAVHSTRLWMSSGATRSSLTSTRTRTSCSRSTAPSRSTFGRRARHLTYMDYDRFGLSPVNPDAVDLEQYPLFASLRGGMRAVLRKGDALFIPDGWWHQVQTWPGRNVAVAWEMEPYEGVEQLWPDPAAFAAYRSEPKMSAQARVKYANKRRVTMAHGPVACNATLPPSVTAADFKCDEQYGSAAECNYKCLPYTCATEQMLERKHGAGWRQRYG